MTVGPDPTPDPKDAFRQLVAEYERCRNEYQKAAGEWDRALAHARSNTYGGVGYPNADQIESEAERQERALKEAAGWVRRAGETLRAWARSNQLDERPIERYLATMHPADYRAIEALFAAHEESVRRAAFRTLADGASASPALPPDAPVPPPPSATPVHPVGVEIDDRVVVDFQRFEIRWQGKVCHFGKPTILFRLFERLHQTPGIPVRHQALQDAVWDGDVRSGSRFRTALRELRETLRDAGMGEIADRLESRGGAFHVYRDP